MRQQLLRQPSPPRAFQNVGDCLVVTFWLRAMRGGPAPLPVRRQVVRSGRAPRVTLANGSPPPPPWSSSGPRTAPRWGAEQAEWRGRARVFRPTPASRLCSRVEGLPGKARAARLPAPGSSRSVLTVLCMGCQRPRSRFSFSESRPPPTIAPTVPPPCSPGLRRLVQQGSPAAYTGCRCHDKRPRGSWRK